MADEFIDGENNDPFDPNTDAVKASNAETKRKTDEDFARTLLETRKNAYYRVFVEGAPSREDRQLVLDDLQTFCRHGQTTYHDNERLHVLLTGRQEVTLRIDDFTKLSVDALVLKYTAS